VRALVAAVLVALAGVTNVVAREMPVGVRTADLVDAARSRTLATEIWYPARSEGRDVGLRRGRWPLVLVAHGSCGFRTNYEYLTTYLAGRGFVVAAPDFPGFTQSDCRNGLPTDLGAGAPGDLSFISRIFHDRTGPLGDVAAHVRGAATGLAGHSLGGLVVVNAALADPTFTAVVALAPAVDAASAAPFGALDPGPAMLVVGGGADRTISFDAVTRPFFDALPAPAYLVRIAAGTHSGFTDMDAGLGAEALAAQEDAVDRHAGPFFDRYLGRRRRAARALRTADDGAVAVVAKTK